MTDENLTNRAQKKAHQRRAFLDCKAWVGLNQRYFYCVRAFFALSYFVLNFVVFANRANLQVADVNEDIFASFVVFDETKAFGVIKEFYRSGCHCGWLWSFPKRLGHRGLMS